MVIDLINNKSLILEGIKDVKINDVSGYAKFLNGDGNIIALYKLNEIKGFYKSI